MLFLWIRKHITPSHSISIAISAVSTNTACLSMPKDRTELGGISLAVSSLRKAEIRQTNHTQLWNNISNISYSRLLIPLVYNYTAVMFRCYDNVSSLLLFTITSYCRPIGCGLTFQWADCSCVTDSCIPTAVLGGQADTFWKWLLVMTGLSWLTQKSLF